MTTEIEGVIRVIETVPVVSKFEESIFIGLSIKSSRSQFTISDWKKERENFESIRLNYKKFTINKTKWYHSAEVFIIPTKVYGRTKIELFLKEHVLLGTGFEIGLYHRDKFTPSYFRTNETICTSIGGTITLIIEWKTEHTNDISYRSSEDWSFPDPKKSKPITSDQQ